jgi:Pex19 protein family
LEKNKDRLGAQEYKAYSTQYSHISKIMKKFDDPAYDDENKTSKTELVEMMQKVFPWR